jgi:hypothetical protein
MTYNVANVAITNTFEFWRGQTNYLAGAMSTYAVTVNSNAAVGNAAITGAFTYGGGQIWQSNVTTTGTTVQVIDSILLSTYKTAEYIISVKDNNANSHYSSKILLTHDIGSAYLTEYAVMQTNNSVIIGPFSASVNTTSAILSFTPVSSNTTVNFNRIAITV